MTVIRTRIQIRVREEIRVVRKWKQQGNTDMSSASGAPGGPQSLRFHSCPDSRDRIPWGYVPPVFYRPALVGFWGAVWGMRIEPPWTSKDKQAKKKVSGEPGSHVKALGGSYPPIKKPSSLSSLTALRNSKLPSNVTWISIHTLLFFFFPSAFLSLSFSHPFSPLHQFSRTAF